MDVTYIGPRKQHDLEMWPEAWEDIAPKVEHLAIGEWREEVKRRTVMERAARKRKIVRDRSGVRNSALAPRASGDRAPAVQALAATAFDFEAWKPWLRKCHC
jgi:hypothetical protein